MKHFKPKKEFFRPMTKEAEENMKRKDWEKRFDRQILYRNGKGKGKECGRWNCMSLEEEHLLKSFIRQQLQQARQEGIEESFDLFFEVLDVAWGNRESADDPKDPAIRISWLREELKGYLSALKKKEGK